MARRHHATMQQLDTLREKVMGYAQRSYGVLETGAGAFAGGLLEGKLGGKGLGPLPFNLLAGVGFLVASNFVDGRTNLGGERLSKHLENFGNGLLASYTTAWGYAFGKRWRETGEAFGGGGRPWMYPYENGWPKPPLAAPTTAGQWPTATPGQWPSPPPSPQQMAQIALQMQAAANAPAYP